MSPSKKRILFMMTGSIAAFKACALLSKLKQAGHDIQVVASPSALKFVGAATLEGLSGKAVLSDLFEQGHAMDHIHAVRWADLILVVPASAHFINRIANGVGDDLVSTMFLAHDFKKPLLVAPAMNTSMYLHPATQASLKTLRSWGVKILEAASGVLACGENGYGRLLEPADLLAEINKELENPAAPANSTTAPEKGTVTSVLVTAGGTTEPLDGVRVLANESTGQTGQQIADVLNEFGMDVTLLKSGKDFRSFQDLQTVLEKELREKNYDYVVHAAAVSDYRLSEVLVDGQKSGGGKIPSGHELTLKLTPNPKLIDQIKSWSKNKAVKLLGFKFTDKATDEQKEKSLQKLFAGSKADWVLYNDTSGIDRNTDKHEFQILDSKMNVLVSGDNKDALAGGVLELILKDGERK